MRFRTGFMVGLGAGYVLGTRAGRGQYERMRQMGEQLMQTDAATKVRRTFEGITDRVTLETAEPPPYEVAASAGRPGFESLP